MARYSTDDAPLRLDRVNNTIIDMFSIIELIDKIDVCIYCVANESCFAHQLLTFFPHM